MTDQISTLLQYATPAVPKNYRWKFGPGYNKGIVRLELQKKGILLWRKVQSGAMWDFNATDAYIKTVALELFDREFNKPEEETAALFGVTRL